MGVCTSYLQKKSKKVNLTLDYLLYLLKSNAHKYFKSKDENVLGKAETCGSAYLIHKLYSIRSQHANTYHTTLILKVFKKPNLFRLSLTLSSQLAKCVSC